MMTTGSPAASLPATRGSDPILWAPPFGGKHGTRLKMSVADFATSFTLSIVLPVRLFCADGLDRSTAATLPVAGGLAASDLSASGLVVSDLAASDLAVPDSAAACWPGCCCASTGDTHAGVSSATPAAMASAVSNAVGRKGQ